MHPEFNQDRKQYTKKFNHGGVKYEIAIALDGSQIVWISGPHRGGKHDLKIFKEGLMKKIPLGALAIADRGYKAKTTSEEAYAKLSIPSGTDSETLQKFKTRARLRLETLNGRLKKYESLNSTFRHGELHKDVFEAIIVSIQYQMDNRKELF